MERRSFLAGILALGAAPAIVKAANIMPVAPKLWVPNQDLTPNEAAFQEGYLWGLSVIAYDEIAARQVFALKKSLQQTIVREWHKAYKNSL
jgi:hypothetical protein